MPDHGIVWRKRRACRIGQVQQHSFWKRKGTLRWNAQLALQIDSGRLSRVLPKGTLVTCARPGDECGLEPEDQGRARRVPWLAGIGSASRNLIPAQSDEVRQIEGPTTSRIVLTGRHLRRDGERLGCDQVLKSRRRGSQRSQHLPRWHATGRTAFGWATSMGLDMFRRPRSRVHVENDHVFA